ncbi:protein kinase domain containing protein, partial [Entamoeba invadens IP1]
YDGTCILKDSNCVNYNKNSICVSCSSGYELDDNYNCILSEKCEYGTTSNCYKCSNKYIREDSNCILNHNCIYGDGTVCIKCENGESHSKCESCADTNCLKCNNNVCGLCQTGYVFNDTKSCEKESFGFSYGISTVYCNNGFYMENSQCKNCLTKHENSIFCNTNISLQCDDNFIITEDGNCITKNCKVNETNEENGQCTLPQEKCLSIVNNKCNECDSNYILTNIFTCEIMNATNSIENCKQNTQMGCIKCDFNYYLSRGRCFPCSENCTSCIETSTKCLSCEIGYYQGDNYKCLPNGELTEKCDKISTVTNGCYQCKDKYYRVGLDCLPCLSNCSTCNTKDKCLTCNDTNYKNNIGLCLPQSLINGCAVHTTQFGCSKCQDNYYTYNLYECEKCNENCTKCTSQNQCTSCVNNKILFENGLCLDISSVKKCTEIFNSKCSKCAFWYSPTNSGTSCNKKVMWWVILMGVILILIVISIIVLIIYFTISKIQRKLRQKEIEETTTRFKMSRSNISFISLGNGIVVNKKEIDFGDDIAVNEKQRELLCVGNTTKYNTKIQITTKSENVTKYKFEAQPNIIVLGKDDACEFEIFIELKCTTKLNERLMLVAKMGVTHKDLIKEVKIKATSKLSTRLDPDELIEEKILGEGSFGVVYKGVFRGNKVAIKKMKNSGDINEENDEFTKEVAMLDKFRSEYIVHFYGAVFIENKVSVVTEYAEYGSLKDLIKHKQSNEVNMKLRVKMMIDAAKGIFYLHENGILHRDIKPDNYLIFSLDLNEKVNAKLTDFGSARNVNLMMTNMTFTKGIGTPIYMAPEVLNREKYKKPADVYSFAITMLECLIWEDAFSKVLYPHPWCIADDVAVGKRPKTVDRLDATYQNVIKSCWEQDPQKRCTIENAITMLNKLI